MGSAVVPPPLHLPHFSSFTKSCLPDSPLCSLLPLRSPAAHPHPPALCYWSAMEHGGRWGPLTQTEIQEDRAQIKNWAHSFLWPLYRHYLTAQFTLLHSQSSACTQACCFLFVCLSGVWPDISFSKLQTIVSVLWVMWSWLSSLWC